MQDNRSKSSLMDEILVLVTVGSEDEASKISKILVENRLAACVNIIPGIRSVFQWEGRIEEEREFLLLVKTVQEAFDQLVIAVKTNHSYSLPEIIVLPISYGSEDYLSWIRNMTKSGDSACEQGN